MAKKPSGAKPGTVVGGKVKLAVENLVDDITPHLTTPLGDAPFVLVDREVGRKLPIDVKQVTFTLAGKAQVHAFNSADDEDPDGILGNERKQNDKPSILKDPLNLRPQIPFDGSDAWLKYRVEAGAKGKAEKELEKDLKFGFSVEAEAGLAFSDYRRHKRSETVGRAVLGLPSGQKPTGDLLSPRLVLFPKDVRALGEGDALAMQARGKIGASVTLSWSDIFSSQISGLGELIDAGDVFRIKVGASASVSVKVSIEDDYLLIFSRAGEGRLRVALRKASERLAGATIGFRIEAGLEDPKAVEGVLTEAIEGLLSQKKGAIDKLLEATSLSPTQEKLLDAILDRLGINNPLESAQDKLKALKKRWSEFEDKVKKAITKAAETKASLSVEYEYSRVATHTSVLQATFDEGRLGHYHGDLLKGRFARLLADAENGDDVMLETFLNERSVVRTRSLGITLGIGKWSLSGKDTKRLISIRRHDPVADRTQIAYQGTRSYTARVVSDSLTWTTDVQAFMPAFSRGADAGADEFRYAFSLIAEWEGKTSGDDIPTYVDQAQLWRSVTAGEADRVAEELHQEIGGRKAKVVCQLTFGQKLLEAAVTHLEFSDDRRFGLALGAAMPWTEGFPPVRQNLFLRRALYGPLWEAYLANDQIGPSDLAAHAGRVFREHDFKDLARFEQDLWTASETTTIAGLARLNGHTRREWRAFCRGMASLRTAIRSGASHTAIADSYGNIQALFAQWHHIRALGVFLLDLVAGMPQLPSAIESSMTVSYTKGGRDESIVYGVARGDNA